MQPAVEWRRRQSGAQGRERVGQGEKAAERIEGLALDQKLDVVALTGVALAGAVRSAGPVSRERAAIELDG